VPKSPNNLVDQLAVVFRNEPFEGTHEPGDMHGTASSQELAADTATGADAGEVSPSPKASPTQAQPVAGPRRLQHDKEARHLEEKDIVHPVFSGFVGNAAAVKTLSIRLRYAAKTESRAIRALGLFGPKSTGKTELARRIAQALGVPPLFLSETGLGDIDNLAERMQALARESGTPMTPVGRQGGLPILRSPPMLVFIDEVHELKPKVQDSLLPVLEADDRTLRGSRVIINARDVTFVVATTDDGRLREPFRSRVRAIRLNVYTAEEVRQMLRHQVNAVSEGESKGSTPIDPVVAQLEDEALLAIATAARAVPRVALDLLREVGEALRIGHLDPSVESVWSYLQGMIPCDRQGLTRQDHQYLQILSTHRGPVGLDNIATQLGIDRSNVDRAIEPFLVQMDWVQRRSGGRVLTPKGQRLLAELRTQAP
jgi:Holliday junction DNA helicase RuvB